MKHQKRGFCKSVLFVLIIGIFAYSVNADLFDDIIKQIEQAETSQIGDADIINPDLQKNLHGIPYEFYLACEVKVVDINMYPTDEYPEKTTFVYADKIIKVEYKSNITVISINGENYLIPMNEISSLDIDDDSDNDLLVVSKQTDNRKGVLILEPAETQLEPEIITEVQYKLISLDRGPPIKTEEEIIENLRPVTNKSEVRTEIALPTASSDDKPNLLKVIIILLIECLLIYLLVTHKLIKDKLLLTVSMFSIMFFVVVKSLFFPLIALLFVIGLIIKTAKEKPVKRKEVYLLIIAAILLVFLLMASHTGNSITGFSVLDKPINYLTVTNQSVYFSCFGQEIDPERQDYSSESKGLIYIDLKEGMLSRVDFRYDDLFIYNLADINYTIKDVISLPLYATSDVYEINPSDTDISISDKKVNEARIALFLAPFGLERRPRLEQMFDASTLEVSVKQGETKMVSFNLTNILDNDVIVTGSVEGDVKELIKVPETLEFSSKETKTIETMVSGLNNPGVYNGNIVLKSYYFPRDFNIPVLIVVG